MILPVVPNNPSLFLQVRIGIVWYDQPHRHTRDADLLGFGPNDLDTNAQSFRDIAAIAAADGIVFDPASFTAEPNRKETGYVGVRILIEAELSRARCTAQIDVGFGDAVTPEPVDAIYPVLLDDLPAPTLRIQLRGLFTPG